MLINHFFLHLLSPKGVRLRNQLQVVQRAYSFEALDAADLGHQAAFVLVLLVLDSLDLVCKQLRILVIVESLRHRDRGCRDQLLSIGRSFA